MALASGVRLGPYEIMSVLGAGGMGEVYKAHDTRLDRTVAIKLLSAELGDDAARRRFQREAQTASSLNHPHILTVYDVGEIEGRQYLVTEFVDGGTLKTWMRGATRTTREIAELLAGVADGLAAAHEAGLLHRDIKPDNILVARNGYAKVADFGLAKLAAPLASDSAPTFSAGPTRAGVIVGTIAYMSPEQAAGRRIDQRSDIFSLGVVLYELLAGRRPFTGATELEVLQTVIHGTPQPLDEDIPQSIRMVVEKALEKDPSDRYQSARDLAVDLRRAARPSATSAVTVPPPRRSGSLVWASGIALVIVVAGAGAYWRTSSTFPAAPPGQIQSLAVLPLQNLSGDPTQEYFSDGATDELIAHLAQIHALKVISRTSIMRYKGSTKSLPEIGRELGVDAIIEGSVRRAGGRVRVTAQLIHAASDTHLWAQIFDRDLADVLTLEADMARAIAQEIRLQLTPEETARMASAPRVNPAARDETLLGHYYRWKSSQPDLRLAIEHYGRALKIEPNYAAAYAGLSQAWQTRTVPGAIPSAREAAVKALEIDSNLAEAHAAMGGVYAQEWNWSAAEREFRRALELNPNSLDACGCFAVTLGQLGRFPEALVLSERMIATNPFSSNAHFIHGRTFYYSGKFDEAVPRFRRALELDADDLPAYNLLAQTYVALGKPEEAVKLLEGPRFQDSPQLAQAYAATGRRAEALKIVQTVAAAPNPPPRRLALAYFALGDDDQGFAWLAKSLDAHEAQAPNMVDPQFNRLRSDPRFQTLLARFKFPLPS